MVRVCAWCQKVMGEKEPLSDVSRTHGICFECFEEVRQKRIAAKEKIGDKMKENPVNPYSKAIDEIITRQVLSTPPDRLTYNDTKWLELNVDAKNSYELRWKVSIPSIRESVKMPKDNPVKKWYIGIDYVDKAKAFISEESPLRKDYPQFTRVIGPFKTYSETVDYIQRVYRIENPIVRKTGRPSRAHYCPERLVSPTKFDPRSFRTKVIRAHRLTLGCPKGQWDDKKGVCRVPMEVQRILHPSGEAKCPVPGKEMGKNPKKTLYDDIVDYVTILKYHGFERDEAFKSTAKKFKIASFDELYDAIEKVYGKKNNPAELATKLDADIEFTAVELYVQGHGVDDVRILLQQEFGIDKIDAEYYARRAGRILRGSVISMSPKTERLLRSL